MIRRLLLFLSIGLVFPEISVAQDSGKPVRILFIGNSYTGQIRKTFQDLVKASLHANAEIETITPGGKTLAFHLANETTVQRIKDGDWDFVVLQDQSQTPAVFPDQFEEAARALDEIIDDAGAETVFYLTWGRRDGDKQNPKLFPTYRKMQDALSRSYQSVARKAKATVAPVGEAWRAVRKADETLGRELYKGDGSHPGAKGAYLAACVFYATLFKADPAKVEFDAGLSAAERATILEAVAETR